MIQYMKKRYTQTIWHTWAGRGRSNLIAGCVLSRLYGLQGPEVAARLQFGYDARGYDNSLVPETARQRDTLRSFCEKRFGGPFGPRCAGESIAPSEPGQGGAVRQRSRLTPLRRARV